MNKKKKSMVNKKFLIILLIVFILVMLILTIKIIGYMIKPSYKKQIEAWAKACENSEKMEEYIKENVNLRYILAHERLVQNMDFGAYIGLTEQQSQDKTEKDLREIYNNLDEKDYKENKALYKETLDIFYSDKYKEIKISNIQDLKNSDDNATIKSIKTAKFDAIIGEKEYNGIASFYDEKIINVVLLEKK